MPVIPVNKAVDPKRTIGKMEGQGGGEAQEIKSLNIYLWGDIKSLFWTPHHEAFT
jgi:hypothetical protein